MQNALMGFVSYSFSLASKKNKAITSSPFLKALCLGDVGMAAALFEI